MSIAPRPEPAPSMAVVDAISFGNAVAMLHASTRKGSESIASLRIPHAGNEAEPEHLTATMLDVVHALWLRRPAISDDIMRLRVRSLPGDKKDIQKTIGELSDKMRAYRPKMQPTTEATLAIRHLDVSAGGHASSEYLTNASALLCGHATLTRLEMQGNHIIPRSAYVLQSLARAVSLSNLCKLTLSSNPIGTRSMVEFLDNLHSPCLTQLRLSMTMQYSELQSDQENNSVWLAGDQSWRTMRPESVWRSEVDAVTDRLILLLQRDRGQRAPFAPRLEWLSLNGNDLGARNAMRITETVLATNFCLQRLELSAVTEVHDALHLDNEEIRDETSPPSTGLRRATSIGSHMLARRRTSLSQSFADGITEQARITTEELVTRSNWSKLLNEHLSENKARRQRVLDASRRLLRKVRTLTCKCHEGPPDDALSGSRKVFPFARLPPEIRQKVVMLLDEVRWLNSKQTERIISFASDPTTIGYGQQSADLGLSQAALDAIRDEANNIHATTGQTSADYGLLLHRPFRWSDMLARHSVPRDWPATLLDEPLRATQQAFATQVDCSDFPPDPSMRQYNSWLAEQSGLQAFWEAVACVFPFAKLPPELCQRVVQSMDDMLLLHLQRCDRLISFAADPATVDYGHDSAFHGRAQTAQNAIHAEMAALERGKASKKKRKPSMRSNGLRPRDPFYWKDMMALHSVPQDWKASVKGEASLEYVRRACDPFSAEELFHDGTPEDGQAVSWNGLACISTR